MENGSNSKWGRAAKEGLILALVTVIVMTLQVLTKNQILSSLLWILKFVGSIWILVIFIKKYMFDNPSESGFSHGFRVCLCSSLICAIYTLLLYGFLFKDFAKEAFEQVWDEMGAAINQMPEEARNMMFWFEDNFAQINCISTFFWCLLCGILFSAIINSVIGKRRMSANNVFSDFNNTDNNSEEN